MSTETEEKTVDLTALLDGFRHLLEEVTAQGQQVSVTVPTAARMLGMRDKAFVMSLIHEGKIRARKHNRTTLVSVKSLHEYMDGRSR